MIADLIDNDYDVRLVSRNVMTVFSSDCSYINRFSYKIKHAEYLIDGSVVRSENVVSFIKRDYNINENIFRYIKKRFDISLFAEYLNYFNKNHLLWFHFSDLSPEDKLLVEILMTILQNKKVVFLDYFDDTYFAEELISLLFHIGLDDRLIIYPCRNISFGISHSTCQCYVKDYQSVKIQSRFSEDHLIEELGPDVRYSSYSPAIYKKDTNYIIPSSYKYSFYEMLMLFIYSIKLLYIKIFNWSLRYNVT